MRPETKTPNPSRTSMLVELATTPAARRVIETLDTFPNCKRRVGIKVSEPVKGSPYPEQRQGHVTVFFAREDHAVARSVYNAACVAFLPSRVLFVSGGDSIARGSFVQVSLK